MQVYISVYSYRVFSYPSFETLGKINKTHFFYPEEAYS